MKTDFDQIKRTTDIVRVVESYGVKLKKVGRNHVGRCCFHADKNPSLIVTADKGLFHCPACGAAGNVIQFVARKEGIGEREAALKLLGGVPGVTIAARVAAPPATNGSAATLAGRIGQTPATCRRVLRPDVAQRPGGPGLLEGAQARRTGDAGSFSSRLRQRDIAGRAAQVRRNH